VYAADGNGSGVWTVLPETDPELIGIPVGTIMYWPGASAPSKWLLCYGQEISRATYSELFNRLGTTYGAGDGDTTFALPDLRGRVAAGHDLAGGISGNRLTSPVDGDTLGAAGGAQDVQVTASHVPPLSGNAAEAGSHTHSMNNSTNLTRFHGAGGSSWTGSGRASDAFANPSVNSGGAHSHTVVVNAGGGQTHNNVQPTIIMNYCIYTGVE
jgi:microcystin-dependent protein